MLIDIIYNYVNCFVIEKLRVLFRRYWIFIDCQDEVKNEYKDYKTRKSNVLSM